jgi:hypothetical protein
MLQSNRTHRWTVFAREAGGTVEGVERPRGSRQFSVFLKTFPSFMMSRIVSGLSGRGSAPNHLSPVPTIEKSSRGLPSRIRMSA